MTAFVGAGLTMKGASFYIIDIADYDSDNVNVEQFQSDQTLWALIGSLFLLFITGTLVQLRFNDEGKQEDDYEAVE